MVSLMNLQRDRKVNKKKSQKKVKKEEERVGKELKEVIA